MKLTVNLILLVCAFLGNTCAATSFYFSTSGDDGNSGTNSESPWKSLSEIYYKAGHIAGHAPYIYAGDSVLLKAGDVFEEGINSSAQGTISNRITFSRYGEGADPILLCDHPNATWQEFAGQTNLFITTNVNRVETVADTNGLMYGQVMDLEDFGGNTNDWIATFTNGSWSKLADGDNTILVRTTDDTEPAVGFLRLFRRGIDIGGHYITIEHLDVRRAQLGIYLGAQWTNAAYVTGTNSILRYCHVEDTLQSCIDVARTYCAEIYSNTVARGGWTVGYLSIGSNNWCHHNVFSGATNVVLGITNPYRGSTELCGLGLMQGVSNLVEHNTFTNITSSCIDFWVEVSSEIRYNFGYGSGAAAYPDGTGLKVHHNVFNVDGGRGVGGAHDYDPPYSPAPDSGTNYIYNNTVYDIGGSYGYYFGTNYDPMVVVRNNIFVGSLNGVNIVNLYNGANFDNNVYFCTDGIPDFYWNNTKYTNFDAYVAVSGMDSNSMYADPVFVETSPTNNPTNFMLATDSPAIRAGVYMFGDADYAGTPARNPPSVGAYEYWASGPKHVSRGHMGKGHIR